jgi:uncharacterized RDD family membrane protein YckC
MPDSPTFLALPGKRVWAGAFDGLTVAVAFLLVVGVAEGLGFDLREWYLFGAIFVVYNFGCLAFRQGRTLGKTAVDICVVTTAGTAVPLGRSAVRVAVRAAPFLLGGGIFHVQASVIALAVLFLVEITIIERSPMRQSLADFAASTFVVNLPTVQPHRAVAGPMFSATDAEFGGYPRPRPRRGEGRLRQSNNAFERAENQRGAPLWREAAASSAAKHSR